MTSELIIDIKTAIKSIEQSTLFNSDSEEKITEACVKYLKYIGFRVVSPKLFRTKIKNNDALIDYFYVLLTRKNPKDYVTSYNQARDRAVAKRFVEGRMAMTGTGNDYALNECGAIIATVIEHEDEFKFKFPLSFAIFGNNKLSWVTDKAVEILNRSLFEKEEEQTEKLREKAIESQGTDNLGFDDLDSILARIEEEEDA